MLVFNRSRCQYRGMIAAFFYSFKIGDSKKDGIFFQESFI
jgi:hypothetical protein